MPLFRDGDRAWGLQQQFEQFGHPSFLPVEQLLFGRAAGRKGNLLPLRYVHGRGSNEYTIAAEKLPGDPGVEICMSQAEFLARGGASAPSPAAFSLRSAENARETAEACGSLKYVSPWAWRAHLDETSGLITMVPPAGAALYFNVQAGSDTALPAGISRKRDFRVQLLDETLAPAASGAPAYLSLVDADGQKIRFSAETGAVVGMTSASGRVLLAEDYFRNVNNTYDHEGSLVSSYSAAEGLMRTRTGADGELVMEWYAPAAVTVLADGTYEVTGEPYKTSSFLSSEENGVRTTVITRQQRGLPAHTITRTEEPGRVSIAKGQGDDTIIRTIETNRLYGGSRNALRPSGASTMPSLFPAAAASGNTRTAAGCW